MAIPSRPTKDHQTATAFGPLSDADFARLSTEEKFRHVHLGMVELAQALDELAATTGRSHGDE
jgi:hypothetical protein